MEYRRASTAPRELGHFETAFHRLTDPIGSRMRATSRPSPRPDFWPPDSLRRRSGWVSQRRRNRLSESFGGVLNADGAVRCLGHAITACPASWIPSASCIADDRHRRSAGIPLRSRPPPGSDAPARACSRCRARSCRCAGTGRGRTERRIVRCQAPSRCRGPIPRGRLSRVMLTRSVSLKRACGADFMHSTTQVPLDPVFSYSNRRHLLKASCVHSGP